MSRHQPINTSWTTWHLQRSFQKRDKVASKGKDCKKYFCYTVQSMLVVQFYSIYVGSQLVCELVSPLCWHCNFWLLWTTVSWISLPDDLRIKINIWKPSALILKHFLLQFIPLSQARAAIFVVPLNPCVTWRAHFCAGAFPAESHVLLPSTSNASVDLVAVAHTQALILGHTDLCFSQTAACPDSS